MSTRRDFIYGLGGSLLLASNPSWAAATATVSSDHKTQTLEGRAFGTRWRMIIPSTAVASEVRIDVDRIVENVNAALSPWRAASEISRFNCADSEDWMPVSRMCSEVIESALDMSRQSEGYFDPTVGAIVNRYGFGPIKGDLQTDIDMLDSRPGAVRKRRSGLTLDPCGIAKGYALDCIVGSMESNGLADYFVELGGEVRASYQHPAGRSWRAGIESPVGTLSASLQAVVNLKNQALATSGTRHNSYVLGRRTYSHIIDAKSRKPVDDALASVSVLAESAMIADAWSTALMAAGERIGTALAERAGVCSLFLARNGLDIRATSVAGFEQCLTDRIDK